MYIPERRDFAEDPKEEILEIKDLWLGRLPTYDSTLQEVGILPTLVYFSPLGLEKRVFFRFRGLFR